MLNLFAPMNPMMSMSMVTTLKMTLIAFLVYMMYWLLAEVDEEDANECCDELDDVHRDKEISCFEYCFGESCFEELMHSVGL
jgi:hypothetical protein